MKRIRVCLCCYTCPVIKRNGIEVVTIICTKHFYIFLNRCVVLFTLFTQVGQDH